LFSSKNNNQDGLLVDNSTFDDAAVVKINDEIALVQTVDFFPPVVDDPYTYGQIAASNALSDVYCMGAKPLTALNILAVPEDLDNQYISAILAGGDAVVQEAGANIVGGHSIIDKEPKYGLSVTGIVHPDKLVTSDNAKIGDQIILTKKIGTGIGLTGLQQDQGNNELSNEIINSMIKLNANASDIAIRHNVHAITDVTGFGLMGHLFNVASASKVSIFIDPASVPLFKGIVDLIKNDISTSGSKRNEESFSKYINNLESITDIHKAVIFDPQTSGGLLLFVSAKDVKNLIQELSDNGEEASIIGSVTKKGTSIISL
tara:strand:- start:230 stop:1180 length:951 start_codon:yes stop_codon:yes gene_type:complete